MPANRLPAILSPDHAEIVAGLIDMAANQSDVFAPEINALAITLALQCPHLLAARDNAGNPTFPTVCQIFNQHREGQ